MKGPLIRRQYDSNAYSLTSALKRNLLWRHNAIGALPPRSIPLTLFPPMGARSDAQGRGHIAARSLIPSDVSVSTHLPMRFVEMSFSTDDEPPIYQFELAATVLTSCLAAYRSGGNPRTCVLRIGNKAAIASLVKGSSSSALCAILVNLFWSVAARCPVVWRFECVGAKSNAAAPPSQLCDAPLGLTCSRSAGEIPPEFSRISHRGWYCGGNPLSLTNAKKKTLRRSVCYGGGSHLNSSPLFMLFRIRREHHERLNSSPLRLVLRLG